MFKSGPQNEMFLQDVLSELMRNNPSEYHEISLVANKIVHYFRRPAHEITVTSIKEGLRFFPLYLSFERLPLYLIEILLKDAHLLVSAAEVIQSTLSAQKRSDYREKSRGVSFPGVGDQVSQVVSHCDLSACAASSSSGSANNAIAEGAQSQ